ncbi:hypothetical protein MSG28_007044 [Choristoneura fumiferana]|uniref:Uncharacterized protein n=1 Tax=Choristoneura fumiferana TaxID=7141 RepID=A0ACC0JM79_CHOFU|nr:hypothetical protein MSG28_007044 [Choristoneura fumiferana]
MSENVNFKDILLPRKTESGIFRFMSRAWYPQRTLTLDKYLSPQDLRDAAANSVFLDSVIETESLRTGVSKEKLKEEVRQYLEEMGLEKKLHVIRWMGVVFLKIAFMMKIGIYVNEPAVLKGLLKALHRLNDNFGNIYINLGAPLSVREYLNNAASDNTERLKPVDLQQLTQAQFQNVQDIANYVITLQQRNTVATISNLLALVLMQSLMNGTALELNEVLKQVEWMVVVLRALGASVFENDVSSSVARVLVIHDKMMRLDRKNRLRLLSIEVVDVSVEVKKKMKGHILKAETMANAVPIIQLQLYVNPMLHYLVPPAVLAVIVTRAPLAREQLNFADSLEYCLQNKVIVTDGDTFVPGSDDKVSYLLKWAVWPALSTLLICADVMAQVENRMASSRSLTAGSIMKVLVTSTSVWGSDGFAYNEI